MFEWIDTEEKGKPIACLDCALIWYKGDYEFGNWNGEQWEVYIDCEWSKAEAPVRYYSKLHNPSIT